MAPMRLNRYLAACGLGSRRQCEQLILDGKVTINRKRCLELATTVGPRDVVSCQGKDVKPEATATVLLHKPPGFLCTRQDPKDRPTIYDLLPPPLKNLHYIGRLDNESEGLLLLTNDGALTQHLTHPSHETEKEYWVVLNRPFRMEDSIPLKAGMQLEEGMARADEVTTLSPRHVSIVLHQGLNRQIRRMFELLNYEVHRLVRIRIGTLDIGQLKPGKWRHLHEPDLEKLRKAPPRDPSKPKPPATKRATKSARPARPASASDQRSTPPAFRPAVKRARPAAGPDRPFKKPATSRKSTGSAPGEDRPFKKPTTSRKSTGPSRKSAGPARKSTGFKRSGPPSAKPPGKRPPPQRGKGRSR